MCIQRKFPQNIEVILYLSQCLTIFLLVLFILSCSTVTEHEKSPGKLSDAFKKSQTGEDKKRVEKAREADEVKVREKDNKTKFTNYYVHGIQSESPEPMVNEYAYSDRTEQPSVSPFTGIFLGFKFDLLKHSDSNFRDYFSSSENMGLFIDILFEEDYLLQANFYFTVYSKRQGTLIDNSLKNVYQINFNIDGKYYFLHNDKLFSPYIGLGLGYSELNWSYKNPILADYGDSQEEINSDSVSGYKLNLLTGINILQTENLKISLNFKFCAILYADRSKKDFENDLFPYSNSIELGFDIGYGSLEKS